MPTAGPQATAAVHPPLPRRDPAGSGRSDGTSSKPSAAAAVRKERPKAANAVQLSLFADVAKPRELELLSSRAFGNGILGLVYRRRQWPLSGRRRSSPFHDLGSWNGAGDHQHVDLTLARPAFHDLGSWGGAFGRQLPRSWKRRCLGGPGTGAGLSPHLTRHTSNRTQSDGLFRCEPIDRSTNPDHGNTALSNHGTGVTCFDAANRA
jgi:hypothetical protein